MDNLKQITRPFVPPHTLMVDGGSHFDCEEVRNYCMSIGTRHHVVTAYSPWINSLLEGYNRIVVEALECLCALGLGEDDYECMTIKDIPNNWPDYLDIVIENLNNHILPSLKYSSNKLMLGLIVNLHGAENPDDIGPPTEEEINIHMALVEQQRLDSYSSMVDHATKCKATFDAKLQNWAPRIVVFQPDDLVQVHETKWVHTFAAINKLIPMWLIPHCIATRQSTHICSKPWLAFLQRVCTIQDS